MGVCQHKDRIEVGKGLEGTLTDATSGQILRSDSVVTAFRNDDWVTGVASITNQVQRRLTPDYAGNYLDVSDISSNLVKKSSKSSDIPIFFKAIFFIFCIPFIISLFKFVPFFRKASYNSKVISGLIYGDAALCGINMILGLFLTPFLFIGVFLILFSSFELGIVASIMRMSRQVNNQLHDQPNDNHGFDGNSNGFNDDADDDGFPFVGYGGFGGGFSDGDSDDENGFGGGSFGGGGASGGW